MHVWKNAVDTQIPTARETGGVLEFVGGFDDQGPLQVNSADGIHILSMNVNMSEWKDWSKDKNSCCVHLS